MDASAIVSSADHRPTLGKVSVGPLGTQHQDILDSILHKQRRKNPVKVCKDAFDNCFRESFKLCLAAMPTEVSDDLMMERTRPMPAEVRLVLFCLFLAVLLTGIFLYSLLYTFEVKSSWHDNANCTVIDFLSLDSTSGEVKLVMKVLEEGSTDTIRDEMTNRINSGWVGHHGLGEHSPESMSGIEHDNPFACHTTKDTLIDGYCCHSRFGFYGSRAQVGKTFPCSFTFEAEYCSEYGLLFDDDWRGFGLNGCREGELGCVGDLMNKTLDHVNQICCEPKMPEKTSQMVVALLFVSVIGFGLFLCLVFKAKHGVWSRLCPFESPPTSAHIYDSDH